MRNGTGEGNLKELEARNICDLIRRLFSREADAVQKI